MGPNSAPPSTEALAHWEATYPNGKRDSTVASKAGGTRARFSMRSSSLFLALVRASIICSFITL